MFIELLPLLKHRAVMITASDAGDNLLRVNVIPKCLEKGKEDHDVLASPLSITATAEELDRDLPAALSGFCDSVLKTGSNLEELKAQHSAAVKALEAENRKKLADRKKSNGGSDTTSTAPAKAGPEIKDGKPVFGSKGSTSGPASLFDSTPDDEGRPDSAPTE